MPRHSSRCLYEDEEFNVKTASEYKQLDCLGIYDTLSEIGRRKREFVYREAEFKLRLIIRRTCTGEVISHLYRNKLDVAERGERGPGGEGPSGRSGGGGGQGRSLFRGGFSAVRRGTIKCNFTTVRRGTIKCNFTAAPQAGKERFLCLIQINSCFHSNLRIVPQHEK